MYFENYSSIETSKEEEIMEVSIMDYNAKFIMIINSNYAEIKYEMTSTNQEGQAANLKEVLEVSIAQEVVIFIAQEVVIFAQDSAYKVRGVNAQEEEEAIAYEIVGVIAQVAEE